MKPIYNSIREKYQNYYLFKRDINGNVIYWTADVYDAVGGYLIRSFYGRAVGSFTQDPCKSISEPIKGTNFGKSNATSDEEQAYKKLDSEFKSHIKKGYKWYDSKDFNNLDNIVDKTNTDKLGYAQPMKFKSFELGKLKYPYILQYKYNGVRCTQFETPTQDLFNEHPVLGLSKEGVEYNVEHLKEEIHKIISVIKEKDYITGILDGEFYIPNINVTTIGGAARNPGNPYHKQLQFIIYDLAIDGYTQIERLKILKSVQRSLLIPYPDNNIKYPRVYISDYIIIYSDEEAMEWLDKALKLGYEGVVLRPLDVEYAFGQRPSFNRKLKRFMDSEFEIIDIVPYGDVDMKVGTGCKVICRNDITNDTFEVIPVGNTDYRLSLVANKEDFIGKKATVKYYERTINKLPFHANLIAIRDYE